MNVRYTDRPRIIGWAGRFNTHGIGEVIVGFPDDGGQTSESISELEVQLSSGEWKDMRQAFADKDLITDNYNTAFFEPATPEDRERGYVL